MACRKDHRDLTPAERSRFVQALHHLKANGVVDQFASIHEDHFHSSAHESPHFLPWHREFVRRFEVELRTFDPDITMPYWDSTTDRDPAGPLWEDAFLGQFDSAWNLNRVLGGNPLPTPDLVQSAMAISSFADFWSFVESGSLLHGRPHNWVGGVMADFASPGDPVFYLHHCWIDLLWAQWQLLHPGAAFDDSVPGRRLNDAMAPWPTTPADVLDHRSINLYHFVPGMQQDEPIVTPETPVINFLEVPEGEARMQAAVFDVDTCEPLHFVVDSGPTVISGPAGTSFSVLGPATGDPRIDRKARVWVLFTGGTPDTEARGTVTFRCEETGEPYTVELTANSIAQPSVAAVMVLDQSNSMHFDSGIGPGITRADVLTFSTPPVVTVLEDVHAMAVCRFDHDAHPGLGMTPVAGAGRVLINGALTSYAPNPDGWTSIGEGVALAHDILSPVTGYQVKAIVVLSDGEENHGPHTRRYIADVRDMIAGLNGHVFAIGLGRPEVLNIAALDALCSGNDGYMVTTGDLTPDASFRLAKFYQQIFAGVTNNEVVLDPDGRILPGQEHRIPFWLNEADISAKAILLSPLPYALEFAVETPHGDIIDPAMAGAHPMASMELGSGAGLYRIALPIPIGANEALAGKWHVVLKISEKGIRDVVRRDQLSQLASAAAHGLPYSVLVHAHSNLRMKAVLAQTSYEPGATVTVRAILTEYGVPHGGPADCRSELTRPDGTTATLHMARTETGVYEATMLAAMTGVYQFRIMAEGLSMRGRKFTREQTRTASVWKGGDRPPPSSNDDPGRDRERICELIKCLLGQKSVQEALRRMGLDPAEIARCVRGYCRRGSSGRKDRDRPLREQLKHALPDLERLQGLLRRLEDDPG